MYPPGFRQGYVSQPAPFRHLLHGRDCHGLEITRRNKRLYPVDRDCHDSEPDPIRWENSAETPPIKLPYGNRLFSKHVRRCSDAITADNEENRHANPKLMQDSEYDVLVGYIPIQNGMVNDDQ